MRGERLRSGRSSLWTDAVTDQRAGYVPFRLSLCLVGAHALCPGHQRRYGDRPENDDVLICRCACTHRVAVQLAEDGVLRPPAGWTVEQFITALSDTRRVRRSGVLGPESVAR